MSIGQAYSHALTSSEQQALQASCDILIDSIFDEVGNIKDTKEVANTTLGIFLPNRYIHRYTPRFLRQFAVCVITVAWKLAQPEHIPLSSLAEELAARVIIQHAKVVMETDEDMEYTEDAFETFEDEYFEDLDFEFLYDDSYDGIDETAIAQYMGISSLALKDWFTPFSDEPDRTPHPFVT